MDDFELHITDYFFPHRRKKSGTGFLFDPETLRAIMAVWADVMTAPPCHTVDKLTIPLANGAAVAITATSLRFENARPDHGTMRAAMLHVANHWGGAAIIPQDAGWSREERLLARAYAHVWGVDLDDRNELALPLSLTKAELDRLPAIVAAIRARHPDAPPARATRADRAAPVRVPEPA